MRSVVTDVWCGYFTGQLSSWHLLCCEEGKFDVCRFYFAFLLLTFSRKQLEDQFTFWSIFWQTGYFRMVCNCYVSPREVMLLVLHRTRRSFRNSQIDPLWSQIDPLCFQARALSRSQTLKGAVHHSSLLYHHFTVATHQKSTIVSPAWADLTSLGYFKICHVLVTVLLPNYFLNILPFVWMFLLWSPKGNVENCI